MPLTDTATWSDRLGQALACYDEPLLRAVAGRLVKPRGRWPAEELVKRGVEAVTTPAVLDRRLKEIEPDCRRLLAVIGHSRQPRWPAGSLVELAAALGAADPLRPVLGLLEAGLLYPDHGPSPCGRCRDFESWLAQSPPPSVFAHPAAAARAVGEDLGLPNLSAAEGSSSAEPQEADGLDWPLRLAALWQQVKAAPLRRTQQGDFFKRDLDRLRTDPLLSAAPADALIALPDMGPLAVALALAEGILHEEDGEVHAAELPATWDEGLPEELGSLWGALPLLAGWDVEHGWRPGPRPGNPYPSAYLLTLLLLARLPATGWARPDDVAAWVAEHHPYWGGSGEEQERESVTEWDGESAGERAATLSLSHSPTLPLSHFLLGLAYPLRLVQSVKDAAGGHLVRLSPLGRWALGLGEPPTLPSFPQTLLVQPNLEILAYRQGLTPALAARLGRFAVWTSLGPACTLQLRPETVYGALEAGESFDSIRELLQRHGMRETPPSVLQSLRTWASKRERISVYPAATLFEFAGPEDLDEALARGLPAVRLSDTLAVTAGERDVDFRHFRLSATRDYTLPPEKCVGVEPDGVTLTLDLGRADLLLESEVRRFAEPVGPEPAGGRKQYRITPASASACREAGLTAPLLEAWFGQRSGQALPAAARLLLTGPQVPRPELERLLVLHVASAEVADGLQQWPGTRALVARRLGPTALAVAADHVALLRERLEQLGLALQGAEA
jgi:hypothetical protein